jgi:hypothetical protein
MADTLDDNVITEEYGVGGLVDSEKATSSSQGFSFGSVPVSESQKETVDDAQSSVLETIEVSTPSSSVSSAKTSVTPSSGDVVTLDNLKLVSAQFEKGCQSFDDLVKGTGLASSVVLACLNWLKDNDVLSVSGKFYCTIDNVSSMQSQFKQCFTCFSQKK